MMQTFAEGNAPPAHGRGVAARIDRDANRGIHEIPYRSAKRSR